MILLVRRLILTPLTLFSWSGTLGLALLSKLIRRPSLSLSRLRELRQRTLRRTNRIVSSLGMDGPLCPVRFWPLLLLCLVFLFLWFLCLAQVLPSLLRPQALFLRPALRFQFYLLLHCLRRSRGSLSALWRISCPLLLPLCFVLISSLVWMVLAMLSTFLDWRLSEVLSSSPSSLRRTLVAGVYWLIIDLALALA